MQRVFIPTLICSRRFSKILETKVSQINKCNKCNKKLDLTNPISGKPIKQGKTKITKTNLKLVLDNYQLTF